MEFCGVFYETGYLRAVYDRIRKLFFVFLMAAVLTVGMMGQGMETINFGSVRLKDMAGRAVAEYAAGVGTTGSFMISVTRFRFRQMFQLIFSLCLRLYRSARKI